MPAPGPNDWLSNHPERGQTETFPDWIARRWINFDAAFFELEVKVLPALDLSCASFSGALVLTSSSAIGAYRSLPSKFTSRTKHAGLLDRLRFIAA